MLLIILIGKQFHMTSTTLLCFAMQPDIVPMRSTSVFGHRIFQVGSLATAVSGAHRLYG
jgi:hypothetical protein